MDANKQKKLTLVGFIIIIFIIWVVFLFSDMGKNRAKEAKMLDVPENITEYAKKENYVTDYTTFGTVEEQIQKFINTITNGSKNDSYEMIGKNLKTKMNYLDYSKKIDDYKTKMFFEGVKTEFYDNTNNVLRVYRVEENEKEKINIYIADVLKANGETTQIGIMFDKVNQLFYIVYLEM